MKKIYNILLIVLMFVTVCVNGQHQKSYNKTVKQYGKTVKSLEYPPPPPIPTYTLTIGTITGSGNVTLDPTGGTYDYGTDVEVTANASAGWSFSSWGGDASGGNPTSIHMTSNKTVTATFTENPPWDGDVWYVKRAADGGSNSNSGESVAQAWADFNAVNTYVQPGDSVYVASGNYGNLTKTELTINVSGTASDRIVIQGYKTTKGDQPKDDWTYGDTYDPAEMPLFRYSNDTGGEGFIIYGSYLTINNIQTSRYKEPCKIRGPHNILENWFLDEHGAGFTSTGIQMQGSKHYYNNGSVGNWPNWEIIGYDSDSCKIINCTVINPSGEGIRTNCEYDTIIDCEVWCDRYDAGGDISTDYYIVIVGSYNHVENCEIHKESPYEDGHYGHGIGIKGNWISTGGASDAEILANAFCVGNTINNSRAYRLDGESFWVAKPSSSGNTISNCTVYDGAQAFSVRDGCLYNTFENCTADTMRVRVSGRAERAGGITIVDYPGEDGDAPTQNTFKNMQITNSPVGIAFVYEGGATSGADDNHFYNCTFHNLDYLMRMDVEGYGSEFKNNIVSDVDDWYISQTQTDRISYTYSDWYDIWVSPTPPSGSGNITGNPLFVDAANGDYTLQTGSPCINAGYPIPGIEYEGTAPDMGAFEKE